MNFLSFISRHRALEDETAQAEALKKESDLAIRSKAIAEICVPDDDSSAIYFTEQSEKNDDISSFLLAEQKYIVETLNSGLRVIDDKALKMVGFTSISIGLFTIINKFGLANINFTVIPTLVISLFFYIRVFAVQTKELPAPWVYNTLNIRECKTAIPRVTMALTESYKKYQEQIEISATKKNSLFSKGLLCSGLSILLLLGTSSTTVDFFQKVTSHSASKFQTNISPSGKGKYMSDNAPAPQPSSPASNDPKVVAPAPGSATHRESGKGGSGKLK